MAKTTLSDTRGILNPSLGEKHFKLSRFLPSSDFCPFIESYWIVNWDLSGRRPYLSETLPFPSIHFAIEEGRADIYGVVTSKFSRRLQGKGRVFGVKFRPAMFHPFFDAPVASLTDRNITLRSVYGHDGLVLRNAILEEHDAAQCARLTEIFLGDRVPKTTQAAVDVRDTVERIATDRDMTRAEQVATLMGVGLRTLQRTFHKYVGVSPKWVIKRYRLQEAANELAHVRTKNLSDLALRMGYFDQAHFIRDFKAVIGKTPDVYAKDVQAGILRPQ